MQLIRPVIAAVVAMSMALASQFALAHGPALETVHEPVALETVHEPVADDSVETLSGTVHEIIVDDPMRGASHRYVELQLADGTLVPLRGANTDALTRGARVEVSGRHQGKALAIDASRALPGDRQVEPKGMTEVDGTLAVLHADYFAEDKSTFIYEVHEASGSVRQLRMGSMPAPLEAGMKVRVHGRVETDNESMTPDRITIVARPTSSNDEKIGGAVAKAATVRSVLVIMANFNNTAVPALTLAQAQQIMTTNGDSVANFFQETSYGQQIMNVTLTGWVTMNLAQPASCGSADWRSIGSSAEAAAKSLGAAYDPATYAFVVYVFPAVPSCGWLGLAYISSPHKAWINGTGAFRTSTIAHEMGHNFGLLHAASLRCSGVAIGGTCSVSEYGDPFDTMGNQRAMHYNAMQKSKLGWIPPSSVKTYTGGSATYTLTPIENAGADTYAVKIPTGATNRTYWLEFRQPIGFDSPLASFPNNGAQIRVAYPFESQCSGCDSYSDDTQIVDTTPGTSAFTDATLVAGQTFTDPDYGINVTVLSASASAMTVQIGAGAAPPPPPPPITGTSTSVVASANPSIAGSTVTFTATVAGNAPTGAVGFQDNGATIWGCASAVLSGSGNTRSATCSTNGLVAGAHAITASYAGDAANSGSTSGSLGEVANPPTNGTNVALAANGGVATASSSMGPANLPNNVNNNQRSGAGLLTGGGGWADAGAGVFPDWVQIDFAGQRTIDHVVVYSVQDDFLNPVEPSDAMTFTRYGLTAFSVQGWNGSAWVTLATVSGNNLVKRVVSFSPFATARIRVVVTAVADNLWSRITEIEAWTSSPPAPMTNYALASNGGVASASSSMGSANLPGNVNNNQRSGAGLLTGGGGWADADAGAFPDWVQINFSAPRTIDHVVVYSVQDNFLSPEEPTDAMTFTQYGLTAFDVQGWSGTGWVTLGSVTGNNAVKRAVWFSSYTTDRIRIVVNAVADNLWSRITEIEAWGN